MRNKLISIIVTWLILHSQISLGCVNPATQLKKGEEAPCTGILFSPEKEKEVRIKIQEHEVLEEQIRLQKVKIELLLSNEEYLNKIYKLEAEKAELWRIRAEESTEKLMSSAQNRGKRDWLFLITGVVLTVGAGYAVGQAGGK